VLKFWLEVLAGNWNLAFFLLSVRAIDTDRDARNEQDGEQ
jgi:hypothetical protein